MRMTPLQKARDARGLTQKQVAARVGVDQTHIARIERGDPCSPGVAAKLARLFKREGITEMHVFYPERFRSFEVR